MTILWSISLKLDEQMNNTITSANEDGKKPFLSLAIPCEVRNEA